MNDVNKTMYIPLYGKAYVTRRGIILDDKRAVEIWEKEGFKLSGKSKSKWLAYYMGMRSRVFDLWLAEKMENVSDAAVIHIGCGMDARVERVDRQGRPWYDIDFPDVISERRKYYKETDTYKMICSNAVDSEWLDKVSEKSAIIIMEGVSMYLENNDLLLLFKNLRVHFEKIYILSDFYSTFAARISKYKNPINDVGVSKVYGLDEPKSLERGTGILFVKEHDMTPLSLIDELSVGERRIFKMLFAGKFAKKMYKLYEFKG